MSENELWVLSQIIERLHKGDIIKPEDYPNKFINRLLKDGWLSNKKTIKDEEGNFSVIRKSEIFDKKYTAGKYY